MINNIKQKKDLDSSAQSQKGFENLEKSQKLGRSCSLSKERPSFSKKKEANRSDFKNLNFGSEAKQMFSIEELIGEKSLKQMELGLITPKNTPPRSSRRRGVNTRSQKTQNLLNKIKFDKKVGKKSNLDTDQATDAIMRAPGALQRFG